MTIDTHIYRERFSEEEIGNKRELWGLLCERWFPKFIGPDDRLLELGSGACELINGMRCKEKIAIDHNPDVTKFAEEDVRCIVAELDAGLDQVDAESVDRVVASNVFEHLPDRDYLFKCLKGAHRVLAPGGTIIIMQPNYAAVKERFYDFSDHSLPLTEKGMAEIVGAAGFDIEYLKARFLPYTTKSRYPAWPILVKLYLRIPLAHRILGGQMFIVARKRELSD